MPVHKLFRCKNYDTLWLNSSPECILRDAAESLFARFLQEKAKDQINVSARLKKALLDDYKARGPCPDTFSDIAKEIFDMMNKDAFTRFKESEKFKEIETHF